MPSARAAVRDTVIRVLHIVTLRPVCAWTHKPSAQFVRPGILYEHRMRTFRSCPRSKVHPAPFRSSAGPGLRSGRGRQRLGMQQRAGCSLGRVWVEGGRCVGSSLRGQTQGQSGAVYAKSAAYGASAVARALRRCRARRPDRKEMRESPGVGVGAGTGVGVVAGGCGGLGGGGDGGLRQNQPGFATRAVAVLSKISFRTCSCVAGWREHGTSFAAQVAPDRQHIIELQRRN